MNGAQFTLIILWSIDLLLAANRHGQKQTRFIDFWTTLLATITLCLILYWGGFWEVQL